MRNKRRSPPKFLLLRASAYATAEASDRQQYLDGLGSNIAVIVAHADGYINLCQYEREAARHFPTKKACHRINREAFEWFNGLIDTPGVRRRAAGGANRFASTSVGSIS
jgi:hypothetical protein